MNHWIYYHCKETIISIEPNVVGVEQALQLDGIPAIFSSEERYVETHCEFSLKNTFLINCANEVESICT